MSNFLIGQHTGRKFFPGDEVTDFRGGVATLVGIEPPHKPSSTGRVYVREAGEEITRSYFPGVYGLRPPTEEEKMEHMIDCLL